MASTWKKTVTELNFSPPYVENLGVNVNVADVMDDSCFLICHAVCMWYLKNEIESVANLREASHPVLL